ncbi:MAG: TonB-dependent receptor, partial [Halieaceae bacterium]|nr:TonB-dependent receptor [Halieaceae bacterium]
AVALFAAGAAATSAPAVLAQGAGEIEEVVITGLRGKPRSAVDSPVAVDVFNAEAIEASSFQDTTDVLQSLIPSYGVSRVPVADGLTFIRPATLRGLPTHHTLVLVNGKRRHRTALVELGGDGTQGPDVATIPSIAIGSVEVLRDGASSQYGSDAIAGVINFNLKDAAEGGSISVDTGQQYEGDGFQTTVQGNIGFALGENGFLNISGEYNDIEFTERAEQYCTGSFCITNPDTSPGNSNVIGSGPYTGAAAGPSDATIVNSPEFQAALPNASVEGDTVLPWGQPNLEALRFFYNAGIDLGNDMELYSFGNYSQSTGDGSFFYRFPGNSVLSDRRLQDGSRWNPSTNFGGSGPSFPAGFTPRFEGEVTDYSALIGLRGVAGEWSWDVSGRYGYSEIDYTLFNTYNPSLGPQSPTSFNPGLLSNEEVQLQFDISRELDFGLASPAVLALGASYMDEEYIVEESSDPASYAVGDWAVSDPYGFCSEGAATAAGQAVIANGSDLDCANSSDPVYRAFPVGSNGFPGYSPDFAGNFTRDSYAVFADLSADVTDRLFLQGAARFEDYSDFGNELVWKVAGLYRLTDTWAVRGSVGTGFRAPTPGQQGTINVATILPFGVPIASGTFPPGGPVAQALGAEELTAETSENYTLGLTAQFDKLTLTIDGYIIDINDRTRFVSGRDVSTDPTAGAAYDNFLALEAAGVPGANTIGQVRWITNALDTRNVGMDIVATYPLEWSNGQTSNLQLAYNYNEVSIESDTTGFLDNEDQFDFENGIPKHRFIATGTHQVGDFSFLARLSYFGEWENSQEQFNGGPLLGAQTFGATYFVDLEGSYQVSDAIRLTVGGRNIFDEFPDELNEIGRADQCCGRLYDSGTIVPWQGGYYYGRLQYNF